MPSRIGAVKAREIAQFLSSPSNANLTHVSIGKKFNCHATAVTAFKRLYRWGKTMKLSLSKIKRDQSLQPREAMDPSAVGDYAEAMKAGSIFPPIIAFYDGTDYWLADGFHRVNAAMEAGIKSFDADVRMGRASGRDAVCGGGERCPRDQEDERGQETVGDSAACRPRLESME